MTHPIKIDYKHIQKLILTVLLKEGVASEAADHVSRGLVHASLRGVDSHGIRLLPHYLLALGEGRINPRPKYDFEQTSQSTGVFNADDTFGHAAGMEAVKKTIKLAREAGVGAVTVKRSSHFGAASFFALEISRHDMIGMSFTNTNSLIIPTGGKRSYLGNNPICFTAPIEDEDPICLDMATSVVTFNKIMRWGEENRQAPPGIGADKNGEETTDPHHITNLFPIGGYKGYGLSFIIEILCSLLTGMPFGPHITKMYEDPMGKKRNLGHFFLAIRIDTFVELTTFKKRMKQLVEELRKEQRKDPQQPVLVAGDPEKEISKQRVKAGIPLSDSDFNFLKQISRQYSLSLDYIS